MSKKSDERAARTAALLAEQRRAERRRRLLVVGAVVAVLAVVIGVGFFIQASRDTTGDAPSTTPSGTDGYSIFVGDESAPTTITVYEDLQCPVCMSLEQATGDQVSQAIEDGKVRMEYRMVSFLDSASDNAYSSRALNAALAVLDTAGVEAFKTFHDERYADQPAENSAGPEDEELIEDAVRAGATESEVRPLIEDAVYAQWIKNATDQMSKEKVNGTPTVEIDGTRVEGSVQDSIDAVLAATQ